MNATGGRTGYLMLAQDRRNAEWQRARQCGPSLSLYRLAPRTEKPVIAKELYAIGTPHGDRLMALHTENKQSRRDLCNSALKHLRWTAHHGTVLFQLSLLDNSRALKAECFAVSGGTERLHPYVSLALIRQEDEDDSKFHGRLANLAVLLLRDIGFDVLLSNRGSADERRLFVFEERGEYDLENSPVFDGDYIEHCRILLVEVLYELANAGLTLDLPGDLGLQLEDRLTARPITRCQLVTPDHLRQLAQRLGDEHRRITVVGTRLGLFRATCSLHLTHGSRQELVRAVQHNARGSVDLRKFQPALGSWRQWLARLCGGDDEANDTSLALLSVVANTPAPIPSNKLSSPWQAAYPSKPRLLPVPGPVEAGHSRNTRQAQYRLPVQPMTITG